jgi:TRAP-type C4-dicarboxylate transport system, small permease component
METLKKIGSVTDKILEKISYMLMTISIIGIFVIINVQVLFRYVLKMSLGGLEELPVYIMALCIWLSAPVITRDDRHINIDFFTEMFKAEWVKYAFKAFAQLVTCLSMGFFTSLAFQYVRETFRYGEVTGGMEIPIWVFHAVITYGSFMCVLYAFINLVKYISKMIETAKNRGGTDAS